MKNETKIIGVSMLTSLDDKDLENMGYNFGQKEFIHNLVRTGVRAGIDGIVSSPKEVKELKKNHESLIFITPGIRLPEDSKNDQKRVESPKFAVDAGADVLVIGRPITRSRDPLNSIKKIIENINYDK